MKLGGKCNQRGFTLQEMLLVILISTILLSVSVVGIVGYMRHLQLAELDNSAKEIFMAAQNRAILLRSSQQLNKLVIHEDAGNKIDEKVDVIPGSDNTTQIEVYYIHCDDENIKNLLPSETIDPALWEGDFWITYEPESGSIIDVFYCDEDLLYADESFSDFYKEWRAASKLARMNRKPMVGYYGGESAESGSIISLRAPVINIYNEDTLRAEITYWVPRTMMTERDKVKLTVELDYQQQDPILMDPENEDVAYVYSEEVSYFVHTYTWTLDSLREDGPRFRDLFGASTVLNYGEDFTIIAEVDYEEDDSGEDLKVNGARKNATDNSLFAKESGGDTAYIACLRHLQNLDKVWSDVSDKITKAVQVGNIEPMEEEPEDSTGGETGTETGEETEEAQPFAFQFTPIENAALSSYDGQKYAIYDLEIAGATGEAAGLFGQFSGTSEKYKSLSNMRLVNTEVTANGGAAGALVGDGAYLTLTNCQIYWENHSEETTNLRERLGDSASGIQYQITGGKAAGGLAGALRNTNMTDCSASSLVQGSDATGGLIGQGSGLSIQRCYAASYLEGDAAAGLIGNLTASGTDIAQSYAVGFIDSKRWPSAKAAGLCLGAGAATVRQSYSAMLFTAEKTVTNYPLCESGTDYTNTYYLASDQFGFDQKYAAWAKSYHVLTDSAQWDGLFGQGVFTAKGVRSYPYNLQTTLSLTTFIYPGLQSLDHWGDWGAQFQNGSLVYYESYKNGEGKISYGFNGGSLSHLRDDQTVTLDGYAVAYRGTDVTSAIDITLDVGYVGDDGQTVNQSFTYKSTGGGVNGTYAMYKVEDVVDSTGQVEDYYLLPLPEHVVNTDYAAGDFYQAITIRDTVDATGQTQKKYYYSPHFANTVLSADSVAEEDLPEKAQRLQVELRTPRHLYMLSRFAAYYTSEHQYRFLQQLDLDYDRYEGYAFQGWAKQNPIGLNAGRPFRCSYYGNYHRITGVDLAVQDDEKNAYQYVGLFGYTTGVLQDIVYQMKSSEKIAVAQSGSDSQVLYAGALAGYNGGTVNNCAASGVQLQANGYQYSTIYLGGLLGRNEGSVRGSAAEGVAVAAEASMSHAYAGGFVGENTASGIVDQCYAVGKVSVSQARYGTVYACGFAGRNSATLSRSYAAVYLLTDGEAQQFGFCPDYSTGCVYLNDGNFTYRGENYAALYTDTYAQAVIWEALAGKTEGQGGDAWSTQIQAVQALGMTQGAQSDQGQNYPYPGAVTAKGGSRIHYGQWPERMQLGTMGVYYWEKLSIKGTDSYYLSAISAIAGDRPMKSGTLSTAHGDGGIVTEYGYGYFSMKEAQGVVETTLTSQNIGYSLGQNQGATTDVAFSTDKAAENQSANDALSELMGGQYTFHSYNTWQAGEKQGLFVIQSGQAKEGEPPYGVWTVKKGAQSLTVQLNPFFADAMSCTDSAKQGSTAPAELPGTEKNPYGVRSIDQLQFINWNVNQRNTIRRMDDGNKTNYPYLSYSTDKSLMTRAFYWEQTHDLKGAEGVTYTPIAEVYDPTSEQQGVLFGWFGGTYNGNDYLIEEVNIKGQSESSCVGLFGAVFNGTLKNIVLYSKNGTATVEGNNSGSSRWYAIGGLAGLAGSTQGSAVVNCTVAGYTIKDTHQSTQAGGWGGTGLGGLIGVSDMSLTGCTAVTNIALNSRDNDNVRVGGLVGSCQGSINSCYAGGKIQVASTSTTRNDRGIYIGSMVGGIYMKPLRVGNSGATVGHSGQQLQNTLKNCYTYVTLPAIGDNQYIKGLYAVGGSGELNVQGTNDGNADHGWTNYDNNYYLASEVLKNNGGKLPEKHPTASHDVKTDGTKVTALTYAQMSDPGKDGLQQKLNANGAGFATVTTTSSSGAPLNGRYSFGSDLGLLGRDYPFPTILTQASELVESKRANVHYGNWPLAGIRRENGALPVNLDLFADYETGKGAVQTELLSLENVPGGGTWQVNSEELETAGIVKAVLENGETDDQKKLLITGLQVGNTVVKVAYTAPGESEPYELNINVNVAAELRLAADTGSLSPVTLLTDATASTPLKLLNSDDKLLNEELLDQQSANAVTLSNFKVEFDSDYLLKAAVEQQDGLTLAAESKTAPVNNTQVTVRYDYTYLGETYQGISSLALCVVEPEITLKPVVFTFAQDAAEGEKTLEYTGAEAGAFTIQLDGQDISVTDLKIAAFKEVPAEYKDVILAEWAKDADGKVQEGTLLITAYKPQRDLVPAIVEVQFQFTYEGSVHQVWEYLEVQVKKESETGNAEEEQP